MRYILAVVLMLFGAIHASEEVNGDAPTESKLNNTSPIGEKEEVTSLDVLLKDIELDISSDLNTLLTNIVRDFSTEEKIAFDPDMEEMLKSYVKMDSEERKVKLAQVRAMGEVMSSFNVKLENSWIDFEK